MKKPIVILSTLMLLMVAFGLWYCTKNKNPMGPESANFNIESLSRSIVEPCDTIVIHGAFDGFNDSDFVVMADTVPLFVSAYTSDAIIVMVPVNGGSANKSFTIQIKSSSGKSVSNTKTVSVSPLPQKYTTPGQYTLEMVANIISFTGTLKTALCRDTLFFPPGMDSTAAATELSGHLAAVEDLFTKLRTAVSSIPDDDKRMIDGMIIKTGLDSIVNALPGLRKMLAGAGTADYRRFYLYYGIDAVSALITAGRQIASIAGIILAPTGVGGVVFYAINFGFTIIDNIIDGYLISDCDSLSLEFPDGRNNVPYLNDTNFALIKGRFRTQTDPVYGTTSLTLSEIASMAISFAPGNDAIKKMVEQVVKRTLSFCLGAGLDSIKPYNAFSSSWKQAYYRDAAVNVKTYEGVAGVLSSINYLLNVNILWPATIALDSYFSGATITTSTNASYNKNNSTVYTLSSGSAYVKIPAYKFAPGVYPLKPGFLNACMTILTMTFSFEIPMEPKNARMQFTVGTNLRPVLKINQIAVSGHPTISIYSTVKKSTGEVITGLTSSDFLLKEDGVTQTITSVTAPSATGGAAAVGDYVLVLDYSSSMSSTAISDMEQAARTFINALPTGSNVALIKFAASAKAINGGLFSNNKSDMLGLVDSAYGGGRGSTALWDAVVRGLTLLQYRSAKRVLIAFTDGQDNASSATVNQAISSAEQANATVHTIGAGAVDAASLTTLADNTGGHYYVMSGSALSKSLLKLSTAAADTMTLSAIFNDILGRESNQYIINYRTSKTLDNSSHAICVTYDSTTACDSAVFKYFVINKYPSVIFSAVTYSTGDTAQTALLRWDTTGHSYTYGYNIYYNKCYGLNPILLT